MTQDTFDRICKTLHDKRHAIISAKRPEYIEGSSDILNNFKVVAKELNVEPLQVWYIYFRKHIASISQYCSLGLASEPIDERFADAMNYLELGLALIKENEPTTLSIPRAALPKVGVHQSCTPEDDDEIPF